MSKDFFVSDTHFGHSKEFLWKKRGFTSIEEHDEAIFNNIMAVANQNDTLWNLGDVYLTQLSDQNRGRLATIAASFKKAFVLPGNHDTPSKIKLLQEIGYIIQPSFTEFRHDYTISHPPVHTCQLESAYTENGEGRFKANIHGHLHTGIVPDKHGKPDKRYRCVSMEQIGNKPISWEELEQEFRKNKVI